MKTAEEIIREVANGLISDDCNGLDFALDYVPGSTMFLCMELYAEQFKSKWINVKDRLPEHVDEYLVIISTGYKNYISIRRYDGEFWMPTYNCTHWMPLPELTSCPD